MTFRESEFPSLVAQIDRIAKTYPPDAVSLYVQELFRIYKAIPVYPGLVIMCMGKAFEKVTSKDPAPAKGTFIVVRLKGPGTMSGRLVAWTRTGIRMDVQDPAGKMRRMALSHRRIRMIERFRTDTLEAFWPTLVFDRKPKSR